jgi:tetratricopeptide (TPR) repeat protein
LIQCKSEVASGVYNNKRTFLSSFDLAKMRFYDLFCSKTRRFIFIAVAVVLLVSQKSHVCDSFRTVSFERPLTTSTSYSALSSTKYNPNIYDDDNEEDFSSVEEGLRYFREYAKRGLKRFRDRNIEGCLADFDRAANANSSQPLVQRGIALYCAGRYEDASLQLEKDIAMIEGSKAFKASDLRIWNSASLNKLGRKEDAIRALDHTYLTTTGLVEKRFIINCTMSFYANEMPLDDMMEVIGSTDERDVFGFRFFGNFYLGLYYDSIGEPDLARVFLSFPRDSTRYPDKDMWYHLPRFLYTLRGWDDVADVFL